MLVCQRYQPDISLQQDFDWSASAQAYSNLEEMPSFIVLQRHSAGQHTFTTTTDPQCLQGKQLQLYSIVLDHVNSMDPPPLRLIISGTAGTGKSYLIHCLRLLLGDKVQVAAPTGVAAFNIEGHTLHTLLNLPTRGDFKDLEGERLHRKQEMLSSVSYLFIDEMSMVGRKIFGQIDIRLRQIFPHKADQLFGGAPACYLETLVSSPQSWTCLFTPPCHALPSLTSAVQLISSSTVLLFWTSPCVSLVKILTKSSSVTSCYV